MRLFRLVCGIALILVLTILLLEAGARVLLWSPAQEGDIGDIRYGFTPDGLGDYHPGQNGVYTANLRLPYFVRTNSEGFRSTEEHRDGAERILVLGDSQTYGLFVNGQDVWTEWLQFGLRRKGRDVQVLNNGIPGASIIDQLEYYASKGAQVSADTLILAVYVNDVADLRATETIRSQGMRMENAVALSDVRWMLRRNSAAYSLAKSVRESAARLAGRQDNAAFPVNSADQDRAEAAMATTALPFERYEQLFDRLASAVRRDGRVLAVAFIPGPGLNRANAEIGAFVQAISEKRGLPFLDVTPALSGQSDDENFLVRRGDPDYPADVHLSRVGHQRIAAAMTGWIDAVLGRNGPLPTDGRSPR